MPWPYEGEAHTLPLRFPLNCIFKSRRVLGYFSELHLEQFAGRTPINSGVKKRLVAKIRLGSSCVSFAARATCFEVFPTSVGTAKR